jgi:1-acyl-sn-glycerol-3-phosphate acyltransferase
LIWESRVGTRANMENAMYYRHGMCFRISYVFVLSILFWFPQCTRYFWRIFRFLFLERKQDSNVTSVKNVQGCF